MAAAARFLAAVEDGDATAVCALLAPKTREDLEFEEGERCASVVGSLELPGGGQIEETAVWGDRAQARASTDTVFLLELDTGWHVVAAGCVPGAGETYDCLLSGV